MQRIQHSMVGEYHVYTSPDVPALYVANLDKQAAFDSVRPTIRALERMAERRASPQDAPIVLTEDGSVVRFEHKLLADRFHVITSPDLKGLHVTADTKEDAEREAILVVELISRRRNRSHAIDEPGDAA